MPTVNIVAFADKYATHRSIPTEGYVVNPPYITGDTNIFAGRTAGDTRDYAIAFLAFDLSSLPSNVIIDYAKIHFNVAPNEETDRNAKYGICSSFIEDLETPASYDYNISFVVQDSWNELDITSEAISKYNDNKKLYYCFSGSTSVYLMYSRRSTNVPSTVPYLEVSYTPRVQAPTNLSPASEIKMNDQVIRFSWTYTPHTGDSQSKFDLQWSSNGGSTWNTVSQTTSNQYYDMPANTFPVGNIIWRVRVYNQVDIVSEYSEQAAFTSAGKPTTPVLTKPDATENTSTPLIAWTGTGQVMYQAQVLQGETITWDSGEIASTAGQVQVGTALADNTSYTAKVRIKNQYDLWSDWATKAFTVDFELPNKPGIDIIKDLIRYSARITISNPTPDSAGGFEYNEVYRREVDGEWMRIATEVERDSTYEDCAMKSGQPYEYKVRAVGTYGYMDSDVKFSEVKVKDSQLASLTDKSLYVPLRYDPKRTISIGAERALMKFAGRTQAVTEFGEHIDKGIALQFVVESLENVDKLIELVESTETLLFRDGKGRKIYCTVGNLDIEELENYWTVSFAIAETSHQEAV